MNKPFFLILLAIAAVVGFSSMFVVKETEYAIKFQLGRIVKADYGPGLHFKVPFINNVRKFDRRILTLDTPSELMLTSEQKFVNVDSFVKWRIKDVSKFYISTEGMELRALNRLEQIIKDRMRAQIASKTLVEVGTDHQGQDACPDRQQDTGGSGFATACEHHARHQGDSQ